MGSSFGGAAAKAIGIFFQSQRRTSLNAGHANRAAGGRRSVRRLPQRSERLFAAANAGGDFRFRDAPSSETRQRFLFFLAFNAAFHGLLVLHPLLQLPRG